MAAPTDNGYWSRKFLLALYGVHVVILLGLMACHWPALAPNLSVLVGGILGVLGLYFTGNVAHHAVLGKQNPATGVQADVAEAAEAVATAVADDDGSAGKDK